MERDDLYGEYLNLAGGLEVQTEAIENEAASCCRRATAAETFTLSGRNDDRTLPGSNIQNEADSMS